MYYSGSEPNSTTGVGTQEPVHYWLHHGDTVGLFVVDSTVDQTFFNNKETSFLDMIPLRNAHKVEFCYKSKFTDRSRLCFIDFCVWYMFD